jgi:tRNA dimethylallyltransferase
MSDRPPPIVGIVGPTASGKSDLALALGRRLPVEILVADSRQVYRGMDVGTAKPDASARAAVPHHLIDLVDPDEPFTVADWVGRARRLVSEVAARGRLPLLVGGTGLYVSALVDGHDYAGQGWAPDVRAELARRLEIEGLDPLVAELERADPAAARRLDLRNPRRVLRALERTLVSGRGAVPTATPYGGRIALVGLSRPRDEVYARIDRRARDLFAGGLVDEMASLLARGFGPELRPMTGHGYAEAARVLAGEWTIEQAVVETATRTRQYAKRQLTWFRRDSRIAWLRAGGRAGDDPGLVDEAERIVRAEIA